MRYFGIYTDMHDGDIETALNTLGELVSLGAVDFADKTSDDLSERQVEVTTKVYDLWVEEMNR